MKPFPIYCSLCMFRGPNGGPSTSAPCEFCEFKGQPRSFLLDKRVGMKTRRAVREEITEDTADETAVRMLTFGGCRNCPRKKASCGSKQFDDCVKILKTFLVMEDGHG